MGRGNATGWAYAYDEYMFRPEWQLFDVAADPLNLRNLAEDPAHSATLAAMQAQLRQWQADTHDPWLACNPAVPSGSAAAPWMQSHSEICAF